jgi:hypothetical protein
MLGPTAASDQSANCDKIVPIGVFCTAETFLLTHATAVEHPLCGGGEMGRTKDNLCHVIVIGHMPLIYFKISHYPPTTITQSNDQWATC